MTDPDGDSWVYPTLRELLAKHQLTAGTRIYKVVANPGKHGVTYYVLTRSPLQAAACVCNVDRVESREVIAAYGEAMAAKGKDE